LFGPHLIIDGSKCNTQKLADRILIEQLLNDYPRAIGMTKIGGPYMFEYQAPDPAYSGVSGLVVIAESHIAIHTFPELDYFTMDIFSCRNFDHETAIAYIKDALEVREMDRMLVQRGLSFHGPHHGAFGSDAETGKPLHRAAGRRTEDLALAGHEAEIQEHVARREERVQQYNDNGRMIWPQYGTTPDYGTYGASAPDPQAAKTPGTGSSTSAQAGLIQKPLYPSRGHLVIRVVKTRAGARLIESVVEDATPAAAGPSATAQTPSTPSAPATLTLEVAPTEPVQVNPTASMSGLLDKMGGLGTEARKVSSTLDLWERMVRDRDCTILLGLAGPLVPAGARELVVYLIEHRLIDGIVATATNLFHDLHEARGAVHYQGTEQVHDADLLAAGYERQADLFASYEELRQTEQMVSDFSATLGQEATLTTSAFFRRLGAALRHMAPRKGIIQAAAEAGLPIYAPDISGSPFGTALATARAQGKARVQFDTIGDALELAGMLASAEHSGVILVGNGAATPADLLTQAARLSQLPIIHQYSVALGGAEALPGLESVASVSDATLTLPLIVHALAQRCPGTRPAPQRKAITTNMVVAE
jgi:deoxyhypusine synthase/S-adenosylmethionine decarboxylase proenzyme